MAASVTELAAQGEDIVFAEDICKILKMSAQTVRELAKDGSLGFPTIVYGGEVRIPRLPFIKYMRGE